MKPNKSALSTSSGNCLNPGGYLFVGHAESLFGLTQKFKMVHKNNGTAYQRLEVNTLSYTARGSQRRASRLFFESANELFQSLNEAGLELEARPADEEIIRSVRRAVHTLKGDSAACGFTKLSEISHELEDVLTPQMGAAHGLKFAEVVLVAADTFEAMLSAYQRNVAPPPAEDPLATSNPPNA